MENKYNAKCIINGNVYQEVNWDEKEVRLFLNDCLYYNKPEPINSFEIIIKVIPANAQ